MKRYKTKVTIIHIVFVLIGLFIPIQLLSQPIYSFEPTATKLSNNGKPEQKPVVSQLGETIVGDAPMEVLFKANIETEGDYNFNCEWLFSYTTDFENPILRRYGEETSLSFTEEQPWYVKLVVTVSYIDSEGNPISISDESEGYFTIDISESSLKVPNAFSPNGDGINDVFRVNYKSLVRFNAYVFNRWGQQLYHWGLSNIDEGWDGTHNGKVVNDGVYYIVVEAEGSDGIKYKHKGDINVLKGFSGTGNSSSTE